MEHETHVACDKRLEKEGGKSMCCYCAPHSLCELEIEAIRERNKRARGSYQQRLDIEFLLNRIDLMEGI